MKITKRGWSIKDIAPEQRGNPIGIWANDSMWTNGYLAEWAPCPVQLLHIKGIPPAPPLKAEAWENLYRQAEAASVATVATDREMIGGIAYRTVGSHRIRDAYYCFLSARWPAAEWCTTTVWVVVKENDRVIAVIAPSYHYPT